MEGEEGGVSNNRLKKLAGSKSVTGSGEVDYKTKSGTAWSHSYLNQKPWHPLSYPNQRRKWIAEQIHSERDRRAEEIAREYAQEQEFYRQTALISKKDKEKVETMQAVSFMYVRPPGYNPESAKAAEIEEERKKEGQDNPPADAMQPESVPSREKKARPKDVFGRPLPTEEEFEILKNAPRLETGVPGRVKPFGVEVRNVKCLRCGTYGHQSGDRECPLKDIIMPNEESRLKRDDPLTAIMAHVDPSEPLKWELKRKPGNFSPPRGGFKPDDPNQQIVAEEIFDEYGGFLSGDNIPELLANFSGKPRKKKSKKKSKHKKHSSTGTDLRISNEDESTSHSDKEEDRSKKEKKRKNKKKDKKQYDSNYNISDDSESDRHHRKSRRKKYYSSEDSDSDEHHRSKQSRLKKSYSSEDSESDHHHMSKDSKHKRSYLSNDADSHRRHRSKKNKRKDSSSSPEDDSYMRYTSAKSRSRRSYSLEHSDSVRHQRDEKSRQNQHSYTSEDESDRHRRHEKSTHKHHSYSRSYGDLDYDTRGRIRRHRHC